MGKRYESGRTYIAAEPPRRTGGLREGFLLATRSGLPTVPRPLMCVCVCMCMFVCVCVKRASPLLLCTAEMRGFIPLPWTGKEKGALPPLTDKGLVRRVCPRLLFTVLGVLVGIGEGSVTL